MPVPDNYDAFVRHDAEQQAYLERFPKCDKCRKPIQDDYLFDVSGDIYCEGCMNELFKYCTENYIREEE